MRLKEIHALFLIIIVWVFIAGLLASQIAADELKGLRIDWLKVDLFILANITLASICFNEASRKTIAFIWLAIGTIAFPFLAGSIVVWWDEMFNLSFPIVVIAGLTTFCCLLNVEKPVKPVKPWFRTAFKP